MFHFGEGCSPVIGAPESVQPVYRCHRRADNLIGSVGGPTSIRNTVCRCEDLVPGKDGSGGRYRRSRRSPTVACWVNIPVKVPENASGDVLATTFLDLDSQERHIVRANDHVAEVASIGLLRSVPLRNLVNLALDLRLSGAGRDHVEANLDEVAVLDHDLDVLTELRDIGTRERGTRSVGGEPQGGAGN